MLSPRTFVNAALIALIACHSMASFQSDIPARIPPAATLILLYWIIAHGLCGLGYWVFCHDLASKRRFALRMMSHGDAVCGFAFVVVIAWVAATSSVQTPGVAYRWDNLNLYFIGTLALVSSLIGILTGGLLSRSLLSSMWLSDDERHELGVEIDPKIKGKAIAEANFIPPAFLGLCLIAVPFWIALNAARGGDSSLAWKAYAVLLIGTLWPYVYVRLQLRTMRKHVASEDPKLTAINEEIRSLGIEPQPIVLIPGSKKRLGAHRRVYAAGGHGYIYLTPEIVEALSHRELLAIALHETRHVQLHHAEWSQSTSLSWVVRESIVMFAFVWASGTIATFAGLALAYMLGFEIVISGKSLQSWHAAEYECDAFAARTLRDPDLMVSTLRKLVGMAPFGALALNDFPTHPSLKLRTDSLMRLKDELADAAIPET